MSPLTPTAIPAFLSRSARDEPNLPLSREMAMYVLIMGDDYDNI